MTYANQEVDDDTDPFDPELFGAGLYQFAIEVTVTDAQCVENDTANFILSELPPAPLLTTDLTGIGGLGSNNSSGDGIFIDTDAYLLEYADGATVLSLTSDAADATWIDEDNFSVTAYTLDAT